MNLRDQLTRQSRPVLWLVFGAASAVFLIGCINVVSLLLARAEERRRELAVRAALGAGRAALVRQLLVEAGLLAVVGAGAGTVMGYAAFGALVAHIPKWLQLLGDPGIDRRTLVFAGTMALLTVVVGGVVPALRASFDAPRAALGGGARGDTHVLRGRHALLFAEVVLATVLLCAGSIMLRSWVMLNAEESGMDADRVIAVRAAPSGVADGPRRTRFNTLVADAVGRVPGVQAVAFLDMPLLQSAIKGSRFVPPRQVRHPAGMDTDVRVTRWACRSEWGAASLMPIAAPASSSAKVSHNGIGQGRIPSARPSATGTARARSSASRGTRGTCRSTGRRHRRSTIPGTRRTRRSPR
jgi:hypothetical protein